MKIKSLLLSITILPFVACSPNLAKNDRAVLGGTSVEADSLIAKSTVALGIKDRNKFIAFCTGTIVSTNLILTATHCLDQLDGEYSEVTVYFGNSLKKYDTALERSVEKWTLNSNYEVIYNPYEELVTDLHDVALIKINGVIPESNKPVSIIDENLKLSDQTVLTLAGWGVIDEFIELKAKTLQAVDVSLKKYWATHLITDQRENKGACVGDSGGPAFIKENEELIVVGATRGPHMPAFECSGYGEYTNLSVNKFFIQEAAKLMGAEEPIFVTPTIAEKHVFDKTPPTDYDFELIPEEILKAMQTEPDPELETEEIRQNEVIDDADITTPNEYSDEDAYTQNSNENTSAPESDSNSENSDDIKKSDTRNSNHISVTAIF